jgi:splicing factor U2AF 65 kDa subunit
MSMAQTAKIDRKLYVGNLPSGITQRMLIDIVNEAMVSLNVLEEPGNPVVSTWISSDGHYAFVEFRTAEEANHGFKLEGMNIQGCEIKIGRPKAYSGTMNALGLMSQINSI